jgi:hypothetical protein
MTENASPRITDYIDALQDWRGKLMSKLYKQIREAGPELIGEWKWNTPIWSFNGNVVALAAFKDRVKVNFSKGASINDPHGLFNSGLGARANRSIDVREGEQVNEKAFRDLVHAAIDLNRGKSAKGPTSSAKKSRSKN